MLLEAQQHHFSAFVVKDHYCPTMLSAYIAEKYVGDGSCRVFGGMTRENGQPVHHPEACSGCGLCAHSCGRGAVRIRESNE